LELFYWSNIHARWRTFGNLGRMIKLMFDSARAIVSGVSIGAPRSVVDCFAFSSQRMLSFFSIGTRVGLIFLLSALQP
jgi:hypothetical protein